MVLTGCYGKTIYRDDKTGRTIFTFNTKDTKPSNITCLGVCQRYPSDMPLKLEGKIKDEQFHFDSCIPFVNNKEKMVGFLSGKLFKGIGTKTAEKIYDFIGTNIFDYVLRLNAESELSENFSPAIAKEIVSKIKELGKVNKIFSAIEDFNGTISSAIRISEISSFENFLDNVYEIGEECGLSFGCCDGVAKSVGYLPYDRRRIDAILSRAMNCLTTNGNTFSNIRDITKKAEVLCKSSAFEGTVPSPVLLVSAANNKKYKIQKCEDGIRYYPNYLYNSENRVSNGILKLQQSSTVLPFSDEIISEIEKECGITYSESQRNALRLLKSSGVKILTGGPGTGKSTVINGIVKAIKKMFPGEKPLLCAPTGRAAQRLKEVTEEDSSTIHKALNIVPYGNDFVSTTSIDSKFVIVDEASMIDISLLDYLIDAISPSSFVLFCGDTEQLPSVGPGNVLKDIINSNKIEVVTLDVVYRCLEDSLISYNAVNIRNGNADVKEGKDFHMFSFKTEEEMKQKIEDVVKNKHDKNKPFEVQVLSPTKDGEVGTKSLNKSLQKICNSTSSKFKTYDSFKYKISDKIIMTRNNYADGYLNGDIGVVKDVSENAITVELGDDKEIELKTSNLEDVAPAYALTVHKSQGSEFSCVIVVLPNTYPWMLQRNLLYTAVTRAKKEVFIIAQEGAYKSAVQNTKMAERKTSLREKLEKGVFIYG